MNVLVFSVFDNAIQQYTRPFYCATRAMAMRLFSDEVNRSDASNNLYIHPEDFSLFHIASYDEDTALFQNAKLERLAVGSDVKR